MEDEITHELETNSFPLDDIDETTPNAEPIEPEQA